MKCSSTILLIFWAAKLTVALESGLDDRRGKDQPRNLQADNDVIGNFFFPFSFCSEAGGGQWETETVGLFGWLWNTLFTSKRNGSCIDLCSELCTEPCHSKFEIKDATCTCIECGPNAACISDECSCRDGFEGDPMVGCEVTLDTSVLAVLDDPDQMIVLEETEEQVSLEVVPGNLTSVLKASSISFETADSTFTYPFSSPSDPFVRNAKKLSIFWLSKAYAAVLSFQVGPNGNRRLDNPGCDLWPDNSCDLACCAEHDRCFDVNSCNFLSWIPGGDSDCDKCNRDALDCIKKTDKDNCPPERCYDAKCSIFFDCQGDCKFWSWSAYTCCGCYEPGDDCCKTESRGECTSDQQCCYGLCIGSDECCEGCEAGQKCCDGKCIGSDECCCDDTQQCCAGTDGSQYCAPKTACCEEDKCQNGGECCGEGTACWSGFDFGGSNIRNCQPSDSFCWTCEGQVCIYRPWSPYCACCSPGEASVEPIYGNGYCPSDKAVACP